MHHTTSISWCQCQKIREGTKNSQLHLNSAPARPLLFQKMAIRAPPLLHSEGRAAVPRQAQSAGGINSDKLESVKMKSRNLQPPSPHSLSLFCQMRAPAKPRPPFSARCSTLPCLPPDTRWKTQQSINTFFITWQSNWCFPSLFFSHIQTLMSECRCRKRSEGRL